MTELDAAMKAAVDSVDTDRRRRPVATTRSARPGRDGVEMREEHDLPAIVARREAATFTGTLRQQYGPVVATAWTTLREAALLLVLFWTSAILLAFVEVEGAIHVPGVGDATVITVALVVAVTLRAVLAAASRSGQAVESRRR